MEAAKDAVACLDVKAIQELKSLANPPPDCVLVTKAVLLLRKEKRNHSWQNAVKMMNNPKKFLDDIIAFDNKNIDQWILDELAHILALDNFTFDNMSRKSFAASNLCKWVINTVKYNSIYKKVKPLMESADAAERLAAEKTEELKVVQEKVRLVVEKVDALKQKLDEAVDAKRRVEEEA